MSDYSPCCGVPYRAGLELPAPGGVVLGVDQPRVDGRHGGLRRAVAEVAVLHRAAAVLCVVLQGAAAADRAELCAVGLAGLQVVELRAVVSAARQVDVVARRFVVGVLPGAAALGAAERDVLAYSCSRDYPQGLCSCKAVAHFGAAKGDVVVDVGVRVDRGVSALSPR